VHSTKCVTSFVGDDLPFLSATGANDNVGSRYGFRGPISTGLALASGGRVSIHSVVHTSLSQPGQTDSRTCVTSRQKSPVAVAVSLLATPGREQVETILNVDTVAATLVPSGVLRRRSRALSI
jgi:hypothetical protein